MFSEPLHRSGNQLRPVLHPQYLRRATGGGERILQLDPQPLGGDRTLYDMQQRTPGCSSIIDAILIALLSMVESNWKSIAHTTFGASKATGRMEDNGSRRRVAAPRVARDNLGSLRN